MNSTQTHDFYPAATPHDRVTVSGTCTGNTGKSVWIECEDGKKRSFALSKITLESGALVRNSRVVLSMPKWIYAGAFVEGEQPRQPRPQAGATQATTPAMGAPIPPAMLDRILELCDPSKHGNSRDSLAAFGYLIALKEGGV